MKKQYSESLGAVHTHTHTHTHTDTLNKIIIKEKGITLIVLVITIILLLILSGITIQGITHTGIFANAKQAELENKRAQIMEYLKLKLINEQTNNPFGSAEEIITATRNNVVDNIDDLKKIGKEVIIGEISTEEEFKQVEVYFYVTVDGDLYKVELKGVNFVGKIDEMLPLIKIVKITNTTSTITVEVTTARNEGGKLEYYIKSEDEEAYKLIETKEEEKYTYEGLEQGKKYSVKVVVVAKNKKTAEAIGEQTTGEVTELTTANAKFTYNPSNWTNTDVVATASTDVTGFTIQTSLDGQTWSDTPIQTRSTNGPVYARLWDGTNAGGMLTGNVTKIDKTKPVLTQVTPTTNSIRIIATDEQSGIVGYTVTTTESVPTSFTSVTNTKKLDVTVTNRIQNTAYYVWVKDLVGNVNEVKKVSTGIVSGLTTANARFTYSPSSWTNGNVVATASTDVTGFTIQTSLDGKNWSNTPSQTRSTNGAVYARLWDGVNAGGMLTGNISRIDKTAGKVTASTTVTGTSTATLSTTFNDSQSGLSKIKWEWGTNTNYGNSATDTYTSMNGSNAGTIGSVTKTRALTGLSAGTTYYVRITAYDVAGNSCQTTTSLKTNSIIYSHTFTAKGMYDTVLQELEAPLIGSSGTYRYQYIRKDGGSINLTGYKYIKITAARDAANTMGYITINGTRYNATWIIGNTYTLTSGTVSFCAERYSNTGSSELDNSVSIQYWK